MSRSATRGSSFLRRATVHETYNDALFIGFLLVLAWVPLPFGSNTLLAWGLNAGLFGGLLILFEVGLLVSGHSRAVNLRRLWWAVALFTVVCAWILIQVSPWTPAALHNPFWQMSADLLDRVPGSGTSEGRISVSPDADIRGLIMLLTAACAFYLGLQLCRDNRRSDLFLIGLVGIGGAYAAFGLLQVLFFPKSLLWGEKVAYLSEVTSTFINRNSYATYAGIGLIAAAGLLVDVYRRAGIARDLPIKMRARAMLEVTLHSGAWLFGILAIILTALILTTSRAGFASSVFGLMALVILLAALMRRTLVVGILIVPIGALLIVAMTYLGDDLAMRMEFSHESIGLRFDAAKQTFDAALNQPWLGFGYGSFDQMFSAYRGPELGLDLHWDKAHNTYVELLFGLGFPMALVLCALVLSIIVCLFLNVTRRETRPVVSLVALAASVTVLLHAVVDFSLQIQAVTLTFWALLGVGLAQSWSRRIDTSL